MINFLKELNLKLLINLISILIKKDLNHQINQLIIILYNVVINVIFINKICFKSKSKMNLKSKKIIKKIRKLNKK